MGLTIAQIGNEDEERRQMMLELAKERDLDLTVKSVHPTPPLLSLLSPQSPRCSPEPAPLGAHAAAALLRPWLTVRTVGAGSCPKSSCRATTPWRR